MLLLQPLAALLWGFAFFGEVPSAIQWLGNALILVGVAVLSWRGSVEGAREKKPMPHDEPQSEEVALPGPPAG
jgi:drug/metabolite transporter (DMT)-like permease